MHASCHWPLVHALPHSHTYTFTMQPEAIPKQEDNASYAQDKGFISSNHSYSLCNGLTPHSTHLSYPLYHSYTHLEAKKHFPMQPTTSIKL